MHAVRVRRRDARARAAAAGPGELVQAAQQRVAKPGKHHHQPAGKRVRVPDHGNLVGDRAADVGLDLSVNGVDLLVRRLGQQRVQRGLHVVGRRVHLAQQVIQLADGRVGSGDGVGNLILGVSDLLVYLGHVHHIGVVQHVADAAALAEEEVARHHLRIVAQIFDHDRLDGGARVVLYRQHRRDDDGQKEVQAQPHVEQEEHEADAAGAVDGRHDDQQHQDQKTHAIDGQQHFVADAIAIINALLLPVNPDVIHLALDVVIDVVGDLADVGDVGIHVSLHILSALQRVIHCYQGLVCWLQHLGLWCVCDTIVGGDKLVTQSGIGSEAAGGWYVGG
mmetsp:Transcript_36271/g.91596  ORF Transcript_36271/g.91596 Transcript_36271/m.91596 type:complete len:335 (+) Transcript_36271:1467-2471(+)